MRGAIATVTPIPGICAVPSVRAAVMPMAIAAIVGRRLLWWIPRIPRVHVLLRHHRRWICWRSSRRRHHGWNRDITAIALSWRALVWLIGDSNGETSA